MDGHVELTLFGRDFDVALGTFYFSREIKTRISCLHLSEEANLSWKTEDR